MNHLNAFDGGIISNLNQFARKSWLFDQMTAFVSDNHLLKGGVFMVIVWWAWFGRHERHAPNRSHILATLIGCIVALALARVLALTLPFRPRPLHAPALDFVLPHGMAAGTLDSFSSFPSDHAVLFFTLATGLFFVSRTLGLLASLYAAVLIALPRIYLGLHYPTDILAGAVLGVASGALANAYLAPSRLIHSTLTWSEARPSLFYPLLFLMTYQIADMFDSSRTLVSGIFKTLQRMLA